jgi:transcriptional regulator with XRE-family HTH domain
MLKIGKQLRRFRLERKLTHRQLAQAVGLTEGQISRIETDKGEDLRGSTLLKLADALGVKMDDLREPREAAEPSALESSLMAVARRAQSGDVGAQAELQRLYAALAQADAARVEAERSRAQERECSPAPRRRKGT